MSSQVSSPYATNTQKARRQVPQGRDDHQHAPRHQLQAPHCSQLGKDLAILACDQRRTQHDHSSAFHLTPTPPRHLKTEGPYAREARDRNAYQLAEGTRRAIHLPTAARTAKTQACPSANSKPSTGPNTHLPYDLGPSAASHTCPTHTKSTTPALPTYTA